MSGDRPALTAAQDFYQRLLANEPAEAQVQAESLLQERSLTAYYNDVALEGLRFAHNDVLRGVVTVAQLQRIKESALDIVEGLEDAPRPGSVGACDKGLVTGESVGPRRPAGA